MYFIKFVEIIFVYVKFLAKFSFHFFNRIPNMIDIFFIIKGNNYRNQYSRWGRL